MHNRIYCRAYISRTITYTKFCTGINFYNMQLNKDPKSKFGTWLLSCRILIIVNLSKTTFIACSIFQMDILYLCKVYRLQMYSTSVITKGILFQDLLNPKSYGRAYMAYSVIIMSPLSLQLIQWPKLAIPIIDLCLGLIDCCSFMTADIIFRKVIS